MDRARGATRPVASARPPVPTGDGPPPSPEMADLVRLAQRGDAAAFGALYEEYAPIIYRFLRRRLRGPDELAEDLTAEVFVKVFEKLDRYQERGLPFSVWLHRIARNHLVDHLRLGRHPVCSLDDAAELPDRAACRAVGRVLDRQVLGPALARLTGRQRRAVELRFLDGLSSAEAAAVVGCSEAALKKLQARGLAALRWLLDPPAEDARAGPLRRGTATAQPAEASSAETVRKAWAAG